MVSISACHADDQGSIPCIGTFLYIFVCSWVMVAYTWVVADGCIVVGAGYSFTLLIHSWNFFMPEYGVTAIEDLGSVSSCDSLINQDTTELEDIPALHELYMNTQVGLCLKSVLADMLDEGRIDIQQCQAIQSKFNKVYSDAYANSSNRLKLTVSGKLSDFNGLPHGSVFHIKDCTITGPSSSIRLPRGTATFAHAKDRFNSP